MGDKIRSLRIHVSFAKTVAKRLWQKQKTLFKKDNYRCHGPPKKKLVKMSLQWSRFLTLGRPGSDGQLQILELGKPEGAMNL